MKIIIPMAGMGKRMRPQTLTTPKPLIPVAGKPIVQHLVEDIVKVCGEPVTEIAYVVGHFGEQVEQQLLDIAAHEGAKGTICYQDEALGTAHAVLCARQALSGKVVVAFADTLFRANFSLDTSADGIIWVHHVEDPRAFGVVTTDEQGIITGFVEKPQTFVSDQAIIGIYYFRDGETLAQELQYLIDHNIRKGVEYQLTDALENMRQKGTRFFTGAVDEWLDCGNKEATLHTNLRLLETRQQVGKQPASLKRTNSLVVEPCQIGENVVLTNAVVGPHVSIGDNTVIENSVVEDAIIREHVVIKNMILSNSIIGSHAVVKGSSRKVNLSDYSELL